MLIHLWITYKISMVFVDISAIIVLNIVKKSDILIILVDNLYTVGY